MSWAKESKRHSDVQKKATRFVNIRAGQILCANCYEPVKELKGKISYKCSKCGFEGENHRLTNLSVEEIIKQYKLNKSEAKDFRSMTSSVFKDSGVEYWKSWAKRIVDARTNDSVIVEGRGHHEEWSFVASFNSILEAENYIIKQSEEAEGWDGEYFLRVRPQRKLLGSSKD